MTEHQKAALFRLARQCYATGDSLVATCSASDRVDAEKYYAQARAYTDIALGYDAEATIAREAHRWREFALRRQEAIREGRGEVSSAWVRACDWDGFAVAVRTAVGMIRGESGANASGGAP